MTRMVYGVADRTQSGGWSFGPLYWARSVSVVSEMTYHTYSLGLTLWFGPTAPCLQVQLVCRE